MAVLQYLIACYKALSQEGNVSARSEVLGSQKPGFFEKPGFFSPENF
jgi:hypothetical protein